MSASNSQNWKYLEPRPGSFYRQLFIKGRRIRARSLYGWYMSETDPQTPEHLAADFDLPLEAILTASPILLKLKRTFDVKRRSWRPRG
jgi:uncharacterized protein (DUF433 family)